MSLVEWPAQHTTVAIGHQLMALFAVQTSDFQAEILRQQQQKQDMAKRKPMMASKSRCPFRFPFLTSTTASHSVYLHQALLTSISTNQTLLSSQRHPCIIKTCDVDTHSMLYTMSFDSEVEGLTSNLMSWQRKVVIVRATAYVVLVG